MNYCFSIIRNQDFGIQLSFIYFERFSVDVENFISPNNFQHFPHLFFSIRISIRTLWVWAGDLRVVRSSLLGAAEELYEM